MLEVWGCCWRKLRLLVEELPLAIRLFGNGYMIPSYDDTMTGFGNVGVSLMLVLKRGE